MSRGRWRLRLRNCNELPRSTLRRWLARRAQPGKPGQRLGQDLLLLAERKPHLGLPGLGVVVKDDTGNRHDAGLVWQFAAELEAANFSERPDIGRDEVGSVGPVDVESRGRETVAHEISFDR